MLGQVLLVALGGALGASARFGSHFLLERLDWPLPTLVVNLVGSFLLGLLLLGDSPSDGARLLIGIGFLGSFTTLSTYSVELLELWRTGATGKAAVHLLGNALGGPLAALLGWRVAVWAG